MKTVVLNPYLNVNWKSYLRVRTNTHTHTTVTDGNEYPHDVIDLYHRSGYKALSLAEHNTISNYPWQALSSFSPNYEDRDPNTLGMIDIQGNEIGGEDHHRISLFNDYNPPPGVREDVRHVLDEISARNGLMYFAHPGRYWDITTDFEPGEIYSPEWYVSLFEDYGPEVLLGLEVVNGHDRHPRDRLLLDIVLSKLMPNRSCWAIAADDSHGHGSVGMNFLTLFVAELTRENVYNALVSGSFTAHRQPMSFLNVGNNDPRPDITPQVNEIIIDDYFITIDATRYSEIKWYSGYIGEGPFRESRVVGTGEVFEYGSFDGDYVRATLYGDDERVFTLVQPFGFAGEPGLPRGKKDKKPKKKRGIVPRIVPELMPQN